MSQTIKYSNQNKIEFVKELRKTVSDYFKSNNISRYGSWKIGLKTAVMLSIYLVPYILMVTGVVTSFWWVYACWILIGFGKAFVGMGVMHDANHSSYSKHAFVNKIMSSTLYMVGGFPFTWRHQHNTLHHGFTNVDGKDEDISPIPVLRLNPHKPLHKIYRFQHIYAWFFYGMMTMLWVTAKDFRQLKKYKNEGSHLSNKYSYKQLLFILIFAKVIYYCVFVVTPLIFMPFAWYWIVLFFLSMHFTSGFILTVIFQTAHVVPTSKYPLPDDTGTLENNWAVHQLYTTSDFSPKNRILSYFLGGLNYQVEHHLFPNISHVHYRKIAKMVKDMAAKHNLPYHVQPGFFRAVWEHTKMLKRFGRA